MASPGQAGVTPCPMSRLPAEAVEFSVVCAAHECLPLPGGEPEYRAGRVLRVAHADPAIGQAGDLDAVADREAQRTLDPGQTRLRRPFRTVPQLRTCHVLTS